MIDNTENIPILLFKAKVIDSMKGTIDVLFELDPRFCNIKLKDFDKNTYDNGFDIFVNLEKNQKNIHIENFLEAPKYVGMKWEKVNYVQNLKTDLKHSSTNICENIITEKDFDTIYNLNRK